MLPRVSPLDCWPGPGNQQLRHHARVGETSRQTNRREPEEVEESLLDFQSQPFVEIFENLHINLHSFTYVIEYYIYYQ
jgi:hypothetical protein